MTKSGKISPYIRALITVALFYGLALGLNALEGGGIFLVSYKEYARDMVAVPVFVAVGWMILMHLPLLLYFWYEGIPVNRYFSNWFVFRATFIFWYGCVAILGFFAAVFGSKYGWLAVAGILFCIIASPRGLRAQRLADYGSVCASLFVFYRASSEVPPDFWLFCYIGIAVVQILFMALLEMVCSELFVPAGTTGPTHPDAT